MLFLCSISSSLKGITISKAPKMSKESRDTMYLPEFYTIQTCSIRSLSIVQINLKYLSLIYYQERSLQFLVRSQIQYTIAFLMTFLIVLSKAISLQDLAREQSLLSSFLRQQENPLLEPQHYLLLPIRELSTTQNSSRLL